MKTSLYIFVSTINCYIYKMKDLQNDILYFQEDKLLGSDAWGDIHTVRLAPALAFGRRVAHSLLVCRRARRARVCCDQKEYDRQWP